LSASIDTVMAAETPEGIALDLHPAGFPARSAAFLIDLAIRGLTLFACALALGAGGRVGAGLLLITLFVVNWLYSVLFELLPAAATPGKRLVGLHVMMADGLPITPAGCLIRNLLRAVDFMPLLYGFGVLCMLLRRDGRRLGDLAGGTLVVYTSRPGAVGDFAGRRTGAAAPAPPPVALTSRQQAAITAFAWRIGRLTPERAEEIADLAAAVVPPSGAGATMSERLVGIARWLHGQRSADTPRAGRAP
jgi:uncharacterized RDD family membrane protein YckC